MNENENSTGTKVVGTLKAVADKGMANDSNVFSISRTGDVGSSSSIAVGVIGSDVGGIITARGTGEGLVIRLDGRVDRASLRSALIDFLNSRRAFLEGNEVSLEWASIKPEDNFVFDLSSMLEREFSIKVKASRLWDSPAKHPRAEARADERLLEGRGELGARMPVSPIARESVPSLADSDRRLSLFDGLESISSAAQPNDAKAVSYEKTLFKNEEASFMFDDDSAADLPKSGKLSSAAVKSVIERDRARSFAPSQGSLGARSVSSDATAGGKSADLAGSLERIVERPIERPAGFDASSWDDPDARIINGTLRSGQKIESEHSLIIYGDVNSGAEIVAGGDIVVLGTLRGVVHAGAYDETGGGRIIFALSLRPTQLRIGTVISRGVADGVDEDFNFPEVARVEGGLIVVEPYATKSHNSKNQAAKGESTRASRPEVKVGGARASMQRVFAGKLGGKNR